MARVQGLYCKKLGLQNSKSVINS